MIKLVLTCLLAACANLSARAAVSMLLTQTGPNVVLTGTGTLNTSSLYNAGNLSYPGSLQPSSSLLFCGTNAGTDTYFTITGPTSFGSGTNIVSPTSTTGPGLGFAGGSLIVPGGYTSGAALSSSAVFANASFATLGITPGTYTFNWGSGASADSLTLTATVPEPSTWAFVAAGTAGLGVVTLRRRGTARVG